MRRNVILLHRGRVIVVAVLLMFGVAAGRLYWRTTPATEAASQAPAEIDWTPLLPSGPGREYAVALCSRCHTAGILVLQQRSYTMWRDFLVGMNSARTTGGELCACIGGPVDAEEIEILSAYLSNAFGVTNSINQLPLNVNTASPSALSRLPGLSRSDVEALIARRARTAFKSKQEIQELVGPEKFRRIEHFVDAKDSVFRADGLLPM